MSARCEIDAKIGDLRVKAYCIVYEVVDDAARFEEYRRQVVATVEAHQGKFLVRGGGFSVLEGEMPFERIALLEFPSRAAAEGWYYSAEYQRILPIRMGASRSQFVLVDGV
jgi:uncharacterized protein (DUF1330 family)